MTGILKHSKSATRQSGKSPQKGEGTFGSTGNRVKKGVYATVVKYDSDTHAAVVRTENGDVMPGVPRLRSTPGEISPLPGGTQVLIGFDYGMPIIMGCLSLPADNNKNASSVSVSEVSGFGGEGLNKAEIPAGNYRAASEPRDLIPGDWAQCGPDGNAFALLGGGANVMKSGALAQIRTHLINDLVEVLSRNYRMITDMGELTVKNDDGRVNMCFRGGTDQRSETGPDEENWTIRMDMGAIGDVFNLEFTNPKGQTQFKFHVDAEGACEIFGLNGMTLASGSTKDGTHNEEHMGESTSTFGANKTTDIAGSATNTVGVDHNLDTGGNVVQTIGVDWRNSVLRDVAIGAGRNMRVSVQGPELPLPGAFSSITNRYAPVLPQPLANALSFDIQQGDFFIEVGSAASLPTIGNYLVKTWHGDIIHEATMPGRTIKNQSLTGYIENRSLRFTAATNGLPDSVILGGDVPLAHVVKWEQLISYLSALHSAFDTHTHFSGAQFAGFIPVTGLTAPPIIPITPLSTMFPAFRSITTAVAL